MVAFEFWLQKFGRWQGPTNGTLSFWDTPRWQGHSNPTCCNWIHLNFFHSQAVRDTNISFSCLSRLSRLSHPSCKSHLVKLQHFILICRLFDSQNNNRGGYNVGSLYYYAGSKLPIEWWVFFLKLRTAIYLWVSVHWSVSFGFRGTLYILYCPSKRFDSRLEF